jgi:hypothetical protein
MPTRRSFALGLGTLVVLPTRALAAPAVEHRLRVRSTASRLTLTLYLTSADGLEVASESGGLPWHPFTPELHWGEGASAPLVPREGDGKAMRSGPSAWLKLPAGVEVPFPSFTYDWPEGLAEGTEAELRTEVTLLSDQGPVRLAPTPLRVAARTVHDSDR